MSKEDTGGPELFEMDFEDDQDAIVSDESALAELSDEDLGNVLDGDYPDPAPQEEEPADEQDEAEVEEAAEEVAEEDAEEDTDTGSESEDETEDAAEPEPEVTREDLLAIQIEQARTQAEHFRLAHDKLAGKYGELKKRLEREDARPATSQDDDDGYDGEPARSRQGTRVEREIAELRAYQRQQRLEQANLALQEETAQFRAAHPEIEKDQGMQTGLAEALKSRASLVQDALESTDPDIVRRATRYALTDAYMEVKAKAIEERITRKSADQASDLKKRKKAARVSGSTGTKKSVKPKVYKRPDDMPDDALAAAIDAMDG